MSYSAKPLSDYATKLLDPLLEKRSGVTIDLVAAWDELAGPDYRACSRPHKLIWPRITKDEDGNEQDFEPATLVVACVAGYGLFLQHDSEALLARVNSYFGYSAVGRIKIIDDVDNQKSNISSPPDLPKLDEDDKLRLSKALESLEEGPHKEALRELGKDVFSSKD